MGRESHQPATHGMHLMLRSYVTAGLLLASGCNSAERPVGSANLAQKSSIPRVEIVQVVQKDVIHTTSQPATVHPFFQADIISKVSGYIEDVFVDIGDSVKTGQPLCQITIPEMDKQREQVLARQERLKAELARAQAAVSVAEAQVSASEATVEEAASNIEQVIARLVADKAELERVIDLVDKQAVTIAMLDEAQAQHDVSIATKISSEAALRSAKAKHEISKAQLKQTEAEVATAQAHLTECIKEVEEIDAMLQYTTLRAPFDGIITSRAIDPGDFVTGSSQSHGLVRRPLFHCDHQERLRIRVAIPERDAADVDAGDPVTIRLDARPEQPIEATVTRAAQRLDTSTRTMLAEIDIENTDGALLPGMFGCATITTTVRTDAHVLPASALRSDAEGHSYVFVLNTENAVTKTPVVIGSDDGREIEILSGLDGTERVVDAFVGSIEQGQQVEIVQP